MPNRVLIVDDDEMVRSALSDYLSQSGYETVTARGVHDCLRRYHEARPDVALVDYVLPDGNALDLLPKLKMNDPQLPLFVLTGHGTIDLAVQAIKQGAEQFITKPVELPVLERMIDKAVETQRNRRKQIAHSAEKSRYERNPFLGASSVIREFAEEVSKVVESDSPLLIQGETGTGKGVLANWLHSHGPRDQEAFVDLNCAGLSRELLDSELFGFEKGAFTGAVAAKMGLLEVADRGTVFLDEIGDMDPLIQPKLLKVLEEKRFRRLGDVRDRNVDVRLVAATHQDLAKLVAEGRFRTDLFFRISTIPVTIPALRERQEDIPILADQLVSQLRSDLGRNSLSLSDEAYEALKKYRWPGNIRELRNVLERAALLAGSGVIQAADLRFQLAGGAERPWRDLTLQQVEIQYIQWVLEQENGTVELAAARLGIPRSSLYAKIHKYRISVHRSAQVRTES